MSLLASFLNFGEPLLLALLDEFYDQPDFSCNASLDLKLGDLVLGDLIGDLILSYLFSFVIPFSFI